MDNSKVEIPELEAQDELSEAELAGADEAGETLVSKVARFLRSCWARRRMIFTVVAIGTLASIIYALVLPKIYTSTTTLMPPGNISPATDVISMLSPGGNNAMEQLEGESLGLFTPGDLFVTILTSRNVEDGLIKRFNLSRYYGMPTMQDTRKALEGDTKIAVDEKSGVIEVSVTALSPVMAAEIANGYVEELNRVVTENSTSSAHRERIFLEARVSATKQELDETAKQLSQFSTKSGAVDVSSQTKSMVDEGLKLQAELIEGRGQLAALREKYSEENVSVRAQEAHNEELQRELDKMGGIAGGSGTKADADKSPYPTALELPALGLTYYDLERKLTVEQALWESLTKEYEAAKVEEAAEIPSVQVLDAANVPERKSGPSRRGIVEIAMLLSLLLALSVVGIKMIWEGVDSENELKQVIISATDATMQPQRWYWRVPGLGWIRKRATRQAV